MTIRVIIVDDQAMVRAGFAALLDAQPDIDVVGDAADGRQGVELSRRVCPDVVLMDVRMPELDGLEAAREILTADADDADDGDDGDDEKAAHRPKVLMLTTFDVDDYVYEALRVGASGFLLKDAPPADLIAAVRVVASGDALLAPSVTRRLIEEFARQRPAPRRTPVPRPQELTPRETEVLGLIARGLSNQEIAGTLFLAEQTVKTHIGRVLAKLQLR
ncbi:response regulator, partial [Streptomyces sp. NPDC057654]|uniref:response regulator n=1 Tax=Streptomyces sp. NPDC057654 TaxID=3346196 RepID=UPI0036B37BA3